MGGLCNSSCVDIHNDEEKSEIQFVDNKATMRDIKTNKTYEVDKKALKNKNVRRIHTPPKTKKKSNKSLSKPKRR